MSELPSNLPTETVAVYKSYLERSLLTRELLLAKVRSYIQTISEAANQRRGLDIGTAGELGTALMRLLRECEDSGLRHAQAAVFYFLDSEDAEPDLASATGFDDDAEVFNAVCEFLARPDLKIRI